LVCRKTATSSTLTTVDIIRSAVSEMSLYPSIARSAVIPLEPISERSAPRPPSERSSACNRCGTGSFTVSSVFAERVVFRNPATPASVLAT
jgi:hypothetical protein